MLVLVFIGEVLQTHEPSTVSQKVTKLGPWVDGTEVPFDIGSNLIVPSFFMDKANTELPPKIHMSFFSYFAEWQVD